MSEEIKDIGSFFQQSFNDYRVDSGINEWALMKKKLFWQNFFKLSVHTFNVYYASFAIAASVFISTEVYTYLNNENLPQKDSNPVIIQEGQKKIEIIKDIDSVEHKAIPEEKPQPDPSPIKNEEKILQKGELPEENESKDKNETQPKKTNTDTIQTERIIDKNIEQAPEKEVTVDSVDVTPINNNPIQQDSVKLMKPVPDMVENEKTEIDSVVKVKKEVKIQVTPQQMREIKKKKRQQKRQNKKDDNK